MQQNVIDWLMQGGPAVRWQVMRDLLDMPEKKYKAERKKMNYHGWANDLLAHQEKDGVFGDGIYGPKWISTHYTMLTLIRLGLPADNKKALKSCPLLLDQLYGRDGEEFFMHNLERFDDCITGMVLNILCYFDFDDDRIHLLPAQLLKVQFNDGGWNCRREQATHSSFHTTINVMEGLLRYENRFPEKAGKIRAARLKGMKFMLNHKLYQSHRTGEPANPKMTMFSFPNRWKFDVLRGLDFFARAKAEKDSRLYDAMDILYKKRRKDGTWPVQNRHAGLEYFIMEKAGKPSRFNTLRALRIIRWWES